MTHPGALDASGAPFTKASYQTAVTVFTVVIRRTLEGAVAVVLDQAEAPAVNPNLGILFTGP